MPEHLQLQREVPINDRHRRQDKRPRFRPDSPHGFGRDLADKFENAKAQFDSILAGYDERTLLKIVLRPGESLPDFEAIPGIELVSHEDQSVVLAFATNDGMVAVESRLSTLAIEGNVTRKQLLYAIQDFGHWTPEDRTGNALRDEGYPDDDPFIVDVELWPQERADRRGLMLRQFRSWLITQGIEILDDLAQPSLVMIKVRCTRIHVQDLLLNHRDVRTVDLPPRFVIDLNALQTNIGSIPTPILDDSNVAEIVVLDSGLTSGHPLIGPAVGDAQGFVRPDRDPHDHVPQGHGTFVSGLALYGDVAAAMSSRRFVTKLRLFSGKVFADDGTDHTEFVERSIEEAVRYFSTEYGCRVFNLSYGDLNKIYDGRHLRGLAYTLDHISRTLGVLFVVSSGNRTLHSLPARLRDRYPDYLFEQDGRILDPGTALNAITVGGLAQYDVTTQADRYPNHIETVPVANNDQPSPITRCGPSVNGAIKPDFVEYAGNVAIDRTETLNVAGLGVVSLDNNYATGKLFCEEIGSSAAAPVVAHKAARLLGELPGASQNLLRALLGAHARWPEECIELLNPNGDASGRTRLLNAIGYGRIDEDALYRSLHHTVTLFTEENIDNDQHHFFQIPLPRTFWQGAQRQRTVRVSLAYTPETRTTRLDYRATKIHFGLVSAISLEAVTAAFRQNRETGIPERSASRWISSKQRNYGTLQVSEWRFSRPSQLHNLFVVVTRQDSPWSSGSDQMESYAVSAVVSDREQASANLYAEIRALLQARARVQLQG